MAPALGAPDPRRCALALDTPSLQQALGLARLVRPWFGVAKVGLELFGAAGPAAVTALRGEGFDVFVDLKLHDIPNTVGRAARALGALGARYVTLHAAGGAEMLSAGVAGLACSEPPEGADRPQALAITVLTSAPVATAEVLAARSGLAASSGCDGVVCAAADLDAVGAAAPGLLRVVPGIRNSGTPGDGDDQARVATAAEAFAAGADMVVIGRPVSAAGDPRAAAAALLGG